MRTLFLQIEQQDLVQEVATVSGQFRQNLEELVEGIIQNRGNILWGLFLIIVVVLLILVSVQYTLNLILRELREIRKQLRHDRYDVREKEDTYE